MEILSDFGPLKQSATSMVAKILVAQTIDAFIMLIVIFFFFYFFVGKHLVHIASQASSLSVTSLESPIKLNRRSNQKRSADELDILETALNLMRTSLIQAFSELSASEKLLNNILESINEGVIVLDKDFKHIIFNKSMENMFNTPRQDIIGKRLQDVFPMFKNSPAEKNYKKAMRGEKPDYMEASMPLSHNPDYWVRDSFSPLRDADGKIIGVVGVISDITQSKQAEMQLRKFAIVIEQANEEVLITDPDGTINYVNPSFKKKTGFAKDEIIGQTPSILKSGIHGSGFYKKLWSTILNKNIWEGTIHNKCKDGRIVIYDMAITPILNSEGDIAGFVSIRRDVTNKINKEKQLQQALKMESLGVLAGGIAHDFNNILSGLMGFTDLAKMEAGENSTLKRYLDSVSTASLRARELVRHILTFSRESEVNKQVITLDTIIKETLNFIRASLPANIEIRHDFKVTRAKVFGDAAQLHQVLMNLFTNAGYAMKEKGGKLEVVLDTIFVSQSDELKLYKIKSGQYLRLVVSDTGCGIPKAVIDKIYEPFFTTKKRGEGTGMGLSTVYGIIKDMDGTIFVYSEENIGTTFTVLIPLHREPDKAQEIKEPLLKKGRARILVIDDEASILESADEILSRLGYSVDVASSAKDALGKIKLEPHSFDLIITDMAMPGMNGIDLSRKVKSIMPGLPIILSTGFSQNLTEEIYKSAGITKLIMKPLIAAELSEVVFQILASREESDPKKRRQNEV